MTISRRHFQAALLGAAAALAAPATLAQGKTLKLLVGFPPGGGTDAIARLGEVSGKRPGVACIY